MILAGPERAYWNYVTFEASAVYFKSSDFSSRRKLEGFACIGTTVAAQPQWSVFPYKSLYILQVFKFYNCHKTFPLCIIGLKFS